MKFIGATLTAKRQEVMDMKNTKELSTGGKARMQNPKSCALTEWLMDDSVGIEGKTRSKRANLMQGVLARFEERMHSFAHT
jgi:hypothetical protein